MLHPGGVRTERRGLGVRPLWSAPVRAAWLGALLGALALLSLSSAPLAVAAAPPMTIEGMVFTATEQGTPEIIVEAARAVIPSDEPVADLEVVRARMSGNDGATSLDLTCDWGEFDLATSDFIAKGNVRGQLADGRRFVGPWLHYDAASGIASTDAPVRIEDGGLLLRGGGFRYHVREGRLRLTAGASVVEP